MTKAHNNNDSFMFGGLVKVARPKVFTPANTSKLPVETGLIDSNSSARFSDAFVSSLNPDEKKYLAKTLDEYRDKTVVNLTDSDEKFFRAFEIRQDFYKLASCHAFDKFPEDRTIVQKFGNTAFDITAQYQSTGNNNVKLMTDYTVQLNYLSTTIERTSLQTASLNSQKEEVRTAIPPNVSYSEYLSVNEAVRRLEQREKLAQKNIELLKQGEEIRGAIVLDGDFAATAPETKRPQLSPEAVVNVKALGSAIAKLTNKDTAKNRDDAEGVTDALYYVSKLTGKEQPRDIDIDKRKFLVSGEAAKIVRIYNDLAHEVEQGQFVPAKAEKLQVALDNASHNLPADAEKLSKAELKEIAESGGVFRLKGDYGSTKGVKPVDLATTIDESKKIEVAKS